ncbi:hypothetical protein [Enterobacter soli]|uniref:hypothetical protein n=1 Tax=Enterobacter soli TaxID=885040 RepID=UPI00404701D1
MDGRNKHGLSRYIPEVVKREVRQRCGFGCVNCGFGFYDYEHFDPDFSDAKEHNPNGMTLLCSQCNQKRARGRLSAEAVAKANRNPKCLQQGFASEMFDIQREPLEIAFGGLVFYNCQKLIVVNGTPVLSVQPPSEPEAPMLLSGVFCDSQGRETLTINNNEWSVLSGTWDVECVGPKIIIRSEPRKISLVLRMTPPTGIVIEMLDMVFEGVGLRGDADSFMICMDGKKWQKWFGCSMRDCFTGISIQTRPSAANEAVYEV